MVLGNGHNGTLRGLVLTTVMALCLTGLAACGGDSDAPEATTSSVVVTPTPTPTPTPTVSPVAVKLKDTPPGLRRVIGAFYNLGDLGDGIDPAITAAVAGRDHATDPVTGEGNTGTWKKRPLAVVTVGDDVTLAVKTRSWVIVGGWWPSLGLAQPVLGGVRRVLAIGGDAREESGQTSAHAISAGSDVKRSRADSLHIIGFDGQGGAGMLGLTRDYMARPSTGGPLNKINVAMQAGGPKVQTETVSQYTGVPLEGYVLTGFNQFEDLIDLFGPLQIFLPKAVTICPRCRKNLPRGQQALNGEQALDLARARKYVKGGDLGRSKAQGRILLSAAAMAKALGPRALPDILSRAEPYLWTDLSPRRLLTFLAHIYTLKPLAVPNEVAGGPAKRAPNGAQVRVPGEGAKALFADIQDGNLTP